jgi:hypothetical protein
MCSSAHMNAKILIFNLPPKTNNTELSKFCQRFYGQDTSSHKGKYKYRRKGLLDNIPHRKFIRGVLITYEKDMDNVVEFIERYDAKYYVRNIELTPEDEKMMLKEIE